MAGFTADRKATTFEGYPTHKQTVAEEATKDTSEPSTEPLQAVNVAYEYSLSLPALLESLGCSLLLSTYQAGRVVCVGSHQGKLKVSFSYFDQAMGLTRTPSGIVIGSRETLWTLPANPEIAARIAEEGEHDIAFLARSSHNTGPLMGHDLAWGDGKVWIVNTLFNCLATAEAPWSFVPRWKPSFIPTIAQGDCCHLNGLAMAETGDKPEWVTALGETNQEDGWRENKATGGCLIHVPSGEVMIRGLAMPHSPRLYQGELYLLESGTGSIHHAHPSEGRSTLITSLPGFTRGLDFFSGYAFIGLSQIRESAIFGGLPVEEKNEKLRCGVAVIDLKTGGVIGTLTFQTGVEEVFAVTVLPGWRNPVILGPNHYLDRRQTIWVVPPEKAVDHEA